jgi:hypothetical protein
MNQAQTRKDGLILLQLGCLIFLALGLLMLVPSYNSLSLMDFRIAYSGGRCLLHHGDPYNQADLYRSYLEGGGGAPRNDSDGYTLDFETRYFYFPSTFAVTVPLALIPFKFAQVIWVFANAVSFMLAAYLMWDLAAEYAPLISGAFLCFYLINTFNYICLGNLVGIAVSFCVISVWCFLRNRFILVGILCMAISLLIKSHDSGLIFLYFLLAGGILRRRALQSLAAVIACALPVILWLTWISPHWLYELRANLDSAIGPSGVNDPGPAGVLSRGVAMVTDLQSIFSLFRDEPRFYNLASYAVSGVLLCVWGWMALRSYNKRERILFLLAAGSALTMLPFYHRQYDARLLMLTIPAFALIWSRGTRMRWSALAINTAGFLVTADLVWVTYLSIITRLQLPTSGVAGKIHVAALAIPLPLALFLTTSLYLYAAIRSSLTSERAPTGPPLPKTIAV